MIDHGSALTLGATAIDFPLDAAERLALDTHVRTCSSCRAEVNALRSDAAGLAALPPIAPPRWVGRSIGKPRRSARFVLLAAAALLITAAGAVALVGAGLRDHRIVDVLPSPTGSSAPVTADVPSIAPSGPQHPSIDCGTLKDDTVTCFQLAAAAIAGLSTDSTGVPIVEVRVVDAAGTTWCAPPDPCISAPPNSWRVVFVSATGWESVPVYPDGMGGWAIGMPSATLNPGP